MPLGDFDAGMPKFTAAEFDEQAMKTAAAVMSEIADKTIDVAKATKALDSAFGAMNGIMQRSVDTGKNMGYVVQSLTKRFGEIAEEIKGSNREEAQQVHLFKSLKQGIEAYQTQLQKVLKIKEKELKLHEAAKTATQEERDELVALQNAVRNIGPAFESSLSTAGSAITELNKKIEEEISSGNINDQFVKKLEAKMKRRTGLLSALVRNMASAEHGALTAGGVLNTSEENGGVTDINPNAKKFNVFAAAAATTLIEIGKISKEVNGAIKNLAEYRKATEMAAHSLGLINAEPLENVRNSLDLTRQQASQFYDVLKKGAATTGKSVSELSSVAQTLKETFGGDVTKQLEKYIELLKEIPTLQADLSSGDFEDKTAMLYGLASSGKAGDLASLMPTGLFGGEIQRQPGADRLDAAQHAASTQEKLYDFVRDLLPGWTPYFASLAEIAGEATKIATSGAKVLGAISAVIAAQGLASGANVAGHAGTQVAIATNGKSVVNAKKLLERLAAGKTNVLSVLGKGRQIATLKGGVGLGLGAAAIAAGAYGGEYFRAKANKERRKLDYSADREIGARHAATTSRALGYVAGGALIGSAIPGVGTAIGAVVGGLLGLTTALVQSADDIMKAGEVAAKERAKNMELFGTEVMPETESRSSFNKAMRQASDLYAEQIESLVRSGKALENALGELSAGVNNAKIKFYQLQSSLANLKMTQMSKYGTTTIAAKNAVSTGLQSARATFDTKMVAVNKARRTALTGNNLSGEARTALTTQADMEAAKALNEFVEATLNAVNNMKNLPEFVMTQFQFEGFKDMMSNGAASLGEMNGIVSGGISAWQKSMGEISEIAQKKIDELVALQTQDNASFVNNLKRTLDTVGNAPDKRINGDREAELQNRNAELSKDIKKLTEKIERGGHSDRVTIWESQRSALTSEQNKNNAELARIAAQNSGWDKQREWLKKQSQGIYKKDESGNITGIDVSAASDFVTEVEAQAKEVGERLASINNGSVKTMLDATVNQAKRAALVRQKKDTKDATEQADIDAQIAKLNEDFDAAIAGKLKSLFVDTTADKKTQQEQEKSAETAIEFIKNNGAEAFMTAISSPGKAAKDLGISDKKILDQLAAELKDLPEATMLEMELGQLQSVTSMVKNGISDFQKAILSIEKERIQQEHQETSQLLASITQTGKNVVEAIQAANKEREARGMAAIAGASGTGISESGEAYAASMESMQETIKAAAETWTQLNKVIPNLEDAVKKANDDFTEKDNTVQATEKRINELKEKKEPLSKEEKRELASLEAKLPGQKAARAVALQDKMTKTKDLTDFQTTKSQQVEAIGNSIKKGIDIAAAQEQFLAQTRTTAIGLAIAATKKAGETLSDNLMFSDNLGAEAEKAADMLYKAAQEQHDLESKSLDEFEQKVKAAGRAIYESTKKAAFLAAKANGKSDEEATKEADAAAAEAKRLHNEQEMVVSSTARLANETKLKNEAVKAANVRRDAEMKLADIQKQAVDDMMSFAQDFGGSFDEVLQLQNMGVSIEKKKFEIELQTLRDYEKQHVTGAKLAEQQVKVLQQGLKVRRTEIGVAKSLMDRMIGAAFGGIRENLGAQRQLGTSQHLMGVEMTRLIRGDNTFAPGDPKTIKERRRQREETQADSGEAMKWLDEHIIKLGGSTDKATEASLDVSNHIGEATTALNLLIQSTDKLSATIQEVGKLENVADRGAEKAVTAGTPLEGASQYASGTSGAKKGVALVGEKGPELIMMNGGEEVLPADKTRQMLGGSTNGVNQYAKGTGMSKEAAKRINAEIARRRKANQEKIDKGEFDTLTLGKDDVAQYGNKLTADMTRSLLVADSKVEINGHNIDGSYLMDGDIKALREQMNDNYAVGSKNVREIENQILNTLATYSANMKNFDERIAELVANNASPEEIKELKEYRDEITERMKTAKEAYVQNYDMFDRAKTANQRFSEMSEKQQKAFKDWVTRDKVGLAVKEMFKDASGKSDDSKFNQFVADNPAFLTGSDADRNAIVKKYMASLPKEEQERIRNSKAVQDYRQNVIDRKKKEKEQSLNDYDRLSAQHQRAYDYYNADYQNISPYGNGWSGEETVIGPNTHITGATGIVNTEDTVVGAETITHKYGGNERYNPKGEKLGPSLTEAAMFQENVVQGYYDAQNQIADFQAARAKVEADRRAGGRMTFIDPQTGKAVSMTLEEYKDRKKKTEKAAAKAAAQKRADIVWRAGSGLRSNRNVESAYEKAERGVTLTADDIAPGGRIADRKFHLDPSESAFGKRGERKNVPQHFASGTEEVNKVWKSLTNEQKEAFRKWARQDGLGKAVGAMFKDAQGNLNKEAFSKFVLDNKSAFFVGSDEDRNDLIKKHIKEMSPEERKRLGNSEAVKKYREARKKRLDEESRDVDSAFEKQQLVEDHYNSVATKNTYTIVDPFTKEEKTMQWTKKTDTPNKRLDGSEYSKFDEERREQEYMDYRAAQKKIDADRREGGRMVFRDPQTGKMVSMTLNEYKDRKRDADRAAAKAAAQKRADIVWRSGSGMTKSYIDANTSYVDENGVKHGGKRLTTDDIAPGGRIADRKFHLDPSESAFGKRGERRNVPKAFAKGTKNAPNGLAIVGEEGPELIRMGGGEEIMSNQNTVNQFARVSQSLEGFSKSLNTTSQNLLGNQLMNTQSITSSKSTQMADREFMSQMSEYMKTHPGNFVSENESGQRSMTNQGNQNVQTALSGQGSVTVHFDNKMFESAVVPLVLQTIRSNSDVVQSAAFS